MTQTSLVDIVSMELQAIRTDDRERGTELRGPLQYLLKSKKPKLKLKRFFDPQSRNIDIIKVNNHT